MDILSVGTPNSVSCQSLHDRASVDGNCMLLKSVTFVTINETLSEVNFEEL
jgi:hypothetical protein